MQANHRVPTLRVANQYPGDSWRYEYVLRPRSDIGFALGHVLLIPFFTSTSCIHVLRVGPPGSGGTEARWIAGVIQVLQKGLRMWLGCRTAVETWYNLMRVCLDARAYHSCHKNVGSNASPGGAGAAADRQNMQQRHGPLMPLSKYASFYYSLHPKANMTWKDRFAAGDEKVGTKQLNPALFLPTCATVPVVPSADKLTVLQRATGSVFLSALDYYATTPGKSKGRCCFVFWGNRTEIRALYDSCQVPFRYQTVPENSSESCWVDRTPRISRRFKMTLIDYTVCNSAARNALKMSVNISSEAANNGMGQRKRKSNALCPCAELTGVSVDSEGVMQFA